MENWKDIVGYEGLYQVSDLGNVRSLSRINSCGKKLRGGIRRQTINKKNGYCYVSLCMNGKAKNYSVHRLVAKAFIEFVPGKNTVNHINEIKTDNRAVNLEWMSLPDNLRYGTHDERSLKNKPDLSGEKHPNYARRGSKALTHKGKVIGINKKNPNDVIVFDTAATASRELHISSGQLCDAINGKAKSCGGYYWSRENV